MLRLVCQNGLMVMKLTGKIRNLHTQGSVKEFINSVVKRDYLKDAKELTAFINKTADVTVTQDLLDSIKGMLNKRTLLDLVRHFVVFEKSKKEDPQTGVISISTVKKIAAYHQYYAVNAAVASTLRAVDISLDSRIMQSPASYGLPDVAQQPRGDKKAGVVWHTQGSGKSLSMVSSRIMRAKAIPRQREIRDR